MSKIGFLVFAACFMAFTYGMTALIYGDQIQLARPSKPEMNQGNWWNNIPVFGTIIDVGRTALLIVWQGLGYFWQLITFSIPHMPSYISNILRLIMFPMWVGTFYVILSLIRGGS